MNQVESIFDPSIRHKSIKLESDEDEEDEYCDSGLSSECPFTGSSGSLRVIGGIGGGIARTVSRLESVSNYRRMNQFAAVVPEDVSNCVINGKCMTPTVLNEYLAREMEGHHDSQNADIVDDIDSAAAELEFDDDDDEVGDDDDDGTEEDDSLGSSTKSNPIKIVRNGNPHHQSLMVNGDNPWSSSAPSDLQSMDKPVVRANGFVNGHQNGDENLEIAEEALDSGSVSKTLNKKLNLVKIH